MFFSVFDIFIVRFKTLFYYKYILKTENNQYFEKKIFVFLRKTLYFCVMKKRKDIYDKLNHSKYHIRYHFIFSTKYRRKCLCGIEDDVRECFLEISKKCNFRVEHIGIDKDHVHLLVRSCPSMSPLSIVRRLKQLSTRMLWNKCEGHLSRYYWKKRTVWTNGYFCGTIGEISEKNLIEYINNQG